MVTTIKNTDRIDSDLQQFNHSRCERPLSLDESEEEARMSGKERVNADDIELMEGKAIYLSQGACALTRHDFCYSIVLGCPAHGKIVLVQNTAC